MQTNQAMQINHVETKKMSMQISQVKTMSMSKKSMTTKSMLTFVRRVSTSSIKAATTLLCVIASMLMTSAFTQAMAFTPQSTSDSANSQVDIDPNIERREIEEFDIDSENIEIGIYGGIISIEDFASSPNAGLRLAYHINENFFLEANYAQATAGETSFELLSGGLPFLTEEERDYTYYDLSVAYNFNGEVFFTDNWVFNTDFFVILGAGSTDFGGDERFTVNAGAGYRILVTDYLSVRFDVRDYVFNSDIIAEEKSVHNLTATLSASFFF